MITFILLVIIQFESRQGGDSLHSGPETSRKGEKCRPVSPQPLPPAASAPRAYTRRGIPDEDAAAQGQGVEEGAGGTQGAPLLSPACAAYKSPGRLPIVAGVPGSLPTLSRYCWEILSTPLMILPLALSARAWSMSAKS
jgi:hypothetical protein